MRRMLLVGMVAGALAAPVAARATVVAVQITAFQYVPSGWATVDPLNLSGGVGTAALPTGGAPTLKRGDAVSFTNRDPVPHTITKVSGSGSWSSIRAEALTIVTLAIPANFPLGTYVYRCTIHQGMRGSFVVTT